MILLRVAQGTYWNLYILSDIFLDTFSWSGGHTTLDAIACKLPIIICLGELMRGRHSYATLKAIGITQNPPLMRSHGLNLRCYCSDDNMTL